MQMTLLPSTLPTALVQFPAVRARSPALASLALPLPAGLAVRGAVRSTACSVRFFKARTDSVQAPIFAQLRGPLSVPDWQIRLFEIARKAERFLEEFVEIKHCAPKTQRPKRDPKTCRLARSSRARRGPCAAIRRGQQQSGIGASVTYDTTSTAQAREIVRAVRISPAEAP